MKQSHRNILGAVSTVFLIGLLATAAPVRAASTDERIKALEAELNQLKVDQQQVKQEQTQMKQDALAARSKLPSFRYRPGSGLRIRGADRSWEYRVTGEFSTYMSFFGGGGRSEETTDDGGPTQGGMFGRHFQWGHFARMLNGLYEFGLNIKCDRGGSGDCRSSSQRANIRFSTWSPFYPDVQVLATRNGLYSRNSRTSSSSGHTIERETNYDGFLSTGSSKGLGLRWNDVPIGPSTTDFVLNYLSGNDQFNAKMTQDPLPQKGFVLGISTDPLKKSKNKWLKGLNVRFNYVNVAADDNRGANQMRVRARNRTNRATLFSMNVRGRHTYVEPSIDYTVGPFNIAYFWARQAGEQRRTGGCAAGGAACANFSDSRLTVNNVAMGMWLWGPKGFMSGSRNGGWRISYTHNRQYFDAGGAPASASGSEFGTMRRWHHLENILFLRWYQKRNFLWHVQLSFNSISKMNGGTSTVREARRRFGILERGGTYQVLTVGTKWIF